MGGIKRGFCYLVAFAILISNVYAACESCNTSCKLENEFVGSLSSIHITNVTINPSVADPGDLIQINAIVTDVSSISNVTVILSDSDGSPLYSFNLFDDGLHLDGVADDDLFGFVLDTTEFEEKSYIVSITAVSDLGISNILSNAAILHLGVSGAHDMSKFSDKEAFLISSHNWRDVLSLIPSVIWTENNTINKHPVLIYDEQFMPDKVVTVDKASLISDSVMHLSWTFADKDLGSGDLPGEDTEVVIDFFLTDDMYDKMMIGVPRIDVIFSGHNKPETTTNKINVTRYLNGDELDDRHWWYPDDKYMIQAIWGSYNRHHIQRGLNTFRMVIHPNTKIEFDDYRVEIPYFAYDAVSDECSYENTDYDPYQLCIDDVQISETSFSPGDTIEYDIVVRNKGVNEVPFDNVNYVIGSVWNEPTVPINLKVYPYDFIFDKDSVLVPNTNLAPGDTTTFRSILTYSKPENINAYSFDADSIVNFIDEYNPSHLTVVGDTVDELDNLLTTSVNAQSISRIGTSDILSFWLAFNDVVYSEDDYKTALFASTYASLVNSPLVIENSQFDTDLILNNRVVTCIGSVTNPEICDVSFSLEDAQSEYISLSNTDKVIFMNPGDSNSIYLENMETEKTLMEFQLLFRRLSLAGAILGSSKHELLMFTDEVDQSTVNTDLKNQFSSFFGSRPNYLTILGSHKTIEVSEYMYSSSIYGIYRALDASLYADFTGDGEPDIAVGRIQGFTTSDVSGMVARSIFYDDLSHNDQMSFMASSFDYMIDQTERWSTEFDTSGYDTSTTTYTTCCKDFSPSLWNSKDLISYEDHGSDKWAGIDYDEIPTLKSSLVFLDACSTCSTTDTDNFCLHTIKRGSAATLGAVSVAWTGNNIYMNTMNNLFYHNMTLGRAYANAFVYNRYQYQTMLNGDPTLVINSSHRLNNRLVYYD